MINTYFHFTYVSQNIVDQKKNYLKDQMKTTKWSRNVPILNIIIKMPLCSLKRIKQTNDFNHMNGFLRDPWGGNNFPLSHKLS